MNDNDIAQLVDAGRLAPSGDNCQPWQFCWREARLAIHFVPQRAESFFDVNNIASWISLGTVLMNIHLVAEGLGYHMEEALFPSAEAPNLVAHLKFSPGKKTVSPWNSLLGMRCSNRRPYRREILASTIREALQSCVADSPLVQLHLTSNLSELNTLADAVAKFDPLIFDIKGIHHSLYRWVRWSHQETRSSLDGLPVRSLELNLWDRFNFKLMRNWSYARFMALLGGTSVLALRAKFLYRRSAAFGIISVSAATPSITVEAGKIFESIWLESTRLGYSLQPVSGFIFLSLRERLLNGDGCTPSQREKIRLYDTAVEKLFPSLLNRVPVMMFRIGRAADPTERTLRKNMSDVLAE